MGSRCTETEIGPACAGPTIHADATMAVATSAADAVFTVSESLHSEQDCSDGKNMDAEFIHVNTIYELRASNSEKLVAQSTSLECCLREAQWRGAIIIDGAPDIFTIKQIQRPGWCSMWARSDRYGAQWPEAKCEEFRRRYLANERMRDLIEFFDANETTLIRIRKRLGIPSRIFPRPPARSKPRVVRIMALFEYNKKVAEYERHLEYQEHLARRVLSSKDVFPEPFNPYRRPDPPIEDDTSADDLMQYMLTEGLGINEIAKHFKFSTSSTIRKLKATASQYGNERSLRIAVKRWRRSREGEIPAGVAEAGQAVLYYSRDRQPRYAVPSALANKLKPKSLRRAKRRRYFSCLGRILPDEGFRETADTIFLQRVLLEKGKPIRIIGVPEVSDGTRWRRVSEIEDGDDCERTTEEQRPD